MATMRDVAKRAGVSVATVSCALSGAKNVSPKSFKKIQDAIRDLHYIPNSAARSLKIPAYTEIGVILTDVDDSFHVDILKGISSVLQKNQYNLNIAFSDHIQEMERQKIEHLIGKNMAGIILMTCQSENEEFFQDKLISRNIPAVFIEQHPKNLDTNFLCFDNARMIGQITSQLIKLKYENISLVCGPEELSSESSCMNGFLSAVRLNNFSNYTICNTTMSKEDAFKATLYAYASNFPDAVITTSTTIARGLLETARLFCKKCPEDVLIISLGEESWNHSTVSDTILSTNRSAITFGSRAAELLIQNIKTPSLFENKTIVMNDYFPLETIPAPVKKPAVPNLQSFKREINIMSLDVNTISALQILSERFTQSTGIKVNFERNNYCGSEILDTLTKENTEKKCLYDMYLFDVPWIYYIGNHQLLADITDFVSENLVPGVQFLPENLNTCLYNNRFFGIPLIGGAQILFYRKDYFENPVIQREFEKKYNIPLRAPRTWTEFNGICEFFTQTYNPSSPTKYGTSVALYYPEEFACSIMPCLWSHTGQLFDTDNLPCVNSLQNARAFHNLLQTLKYTDGNCLRTSLKSATTAFADGETAMLINFSEYVSTSNLTHKLNGKIGYSLIPGRRPVLPGWNIGVSNYTSKTEEVQQFLKWICSQNVSSYLTILDGQSTIREPYENNELKRLYPWLTLTTDSLKFCCRRHPPQKKGRRIIPQNKIESIITNAFYQTCMNPSELEHFLNEAQKEMTALFQEYRYL